MFSKWQFTGISYALDFSMAVLIISRADLSSCRECWQELPVPWQETFYKSVTRTSRWTILCACLLKYFWHIWLLLHLLPTSDKFCCKNCNKCFHATLTRLYIVGSINSCWKREPVFCRFSPIYLTDISRVSKTCHRAHILNLHLHILSCCTQHIFLQCMGSLIHQCCAPGHWSYKLEANPNNAVHYKQNTKLSIGQVLTVIFNLLLT